MSPYNRRPASPRAEYIVEHEQEEMDLTAAITAATAFAPAVATAAGTSAQATSAAPSARVVPARAAATGAPEHTHVSPFPLRASVAATQAVMALMRTEQRERITAAENIAEGRARSSSSVTCVLHAL